MSQPHPLKTILLLATLALAGGGIALMSAARNSPVRKFTPVPGVAPAGEKAQVPAVAPQPAATKTPAPQRQTAKIPDDIQWRPTFEVALKEARDSGKPLMVDFYTEWCGYCKKLDAEVYTDFGVIAESANFISVKVDAEKRSELAQKYQVTGFPTILWLDGSGAEKKRLPGYTDAPDFLQYMRDARAQVSDAAI